MKLAEAIFRRGDYKKPTGRSLYGDRIHPVTNKPDFHSGVDYGTQGEKWPQWALEEGIVLSCGKDVRGANALFVWIKYPRLGIKVLHYHLDRIDVKKNQLVDSNTCIGLTGQTGVVTDIHLHLGVKSLITNKYFDPEIFDYQPLVELSNPQWVVNGVVTVNDKVKVTGTHYATGQKIPMWVKQKTYTIKRIAVINGTNRALLKEINSWVFVEDIKKVA